MLNFLSNRCCFTRLDRSTTHSFNTQFRKRNETVDPNHLYSTSECGSKSIAVSKRMAEFWPASYHIIVPPGHFDCARAIAMHHWSSKLGRVGRSCQNMEATDSLGSITFTRKIQRSVDFKKSLVALLKIIYQTEKEAWVWIESSMHAMDCNQLRCLSYHIRNIPPCVTAIDGIHWSISTRISEKFACKRSCIQKTEHWKTYFTDIKIHCTLQWPCVLHRKNPSQQIYAPFFFVFFSSFFPGVTDHISFFSCILWNTAHSPWHESSMAESSSDDLLGVDVGMHRAPVPGVCNGQRDEVGKPRPSQHKETNRLPILHEHRRTSSSQWSSKSSITAIASRFSCNFFNFSSIFSAFSQSFKKRRIFSSASFTGSSFFGKVSK